MMRNSIRHHKKSYMVLKQKTKTKTKKLETVDSRVLFP